MDDRTSDFVVIGGGIAGASVAARLAVAGATVCVLEAESRPDVHSTGRSAATYVLNFGNASIRRLTAASRDFLEHPPAGFSEHPLVTPRGVLTVASADQMDAYREVLDMATDMHPVERAEALAMVPVLRDDWLVAAALEPGAMDIDVHALHSGFLRQLRAAGGRLTCGAPVQALERRNGSWVVHTPEGDHAAPVVINAAGAWADRVAVMAGLAPLGIEPRRRTAAIVALPDGIDASAWPMVFDALDSVYFKPEAGKLLLSPADATPDQPGDVQPEDLDVAIAVDRLEQMVNFSVRRVEHRWAGLRTFAPDGTLVIGMDPRRDGFFWLAGQGGYGIQTSPIVSATAANLLTGRGLPEPLRQLGTTERELAPGRFLEAATPHANATDFQPHA